MAGSAPSTAPRAAVRSTGLLAGEAAQHLGVGVQTLHYYEREGLIPAPPRSESGYRLYTPGLVERVRFIRKAQALGLPLEEIRDVLRLVDEGSSPCGRVQCALADTLAEVDRRLRELRSFRRELATLVARAGEARAERGAAQVCAIVEEAPPISLREMAHMSLDPMTRLPREGRDRPTRASPRRQRGA